MMHHPSLRAATVVVAGVDRDVVDRAVADRLANPKVASQQAGRVVAAADLRAAKEAAAAQPPEVGRTKPKPYQLNGSMRRASHPFAPHCKTPAPQALTPCRASDIVHLAHAPKIRVSGCPTLPHGTI